VTLWANGTVRSQLRYDPWGKQRYALSVTPTGYRYTAQRFDDKLGLYDYQARYYDPHIGRFISPDTFIPNPANSQSYNRYSYVLNNALRYVDPTGHFNASINADLTHGEANYLLTAVDVLIQEYDQGISLLELFWDELVKVAIGGSVGAVLATALGLTLLPAAVVGIIVGVVVGMAGSYHSAGALRNAISTLRNEFNPRLDQAIRTAGEDGIVRVYAEDTWFAPDRISIAALQWRDGSEVYEGIGPQPLPVCGWVQVFSVEIETISMNIAGKLIVNAVTAVAIQHRGPENPIYLSYWAGTRAIYGGAFGY